MRLLRIKIENIRSFLGPTEIELDNNISIIIGPNGGGKTNLLDIATTMLRRHILKSWVAVHAPTSNIADRYQFQINPNIDSIAFDKHSLEPNKQSIVELELEVTAPDIANMSKMKLSAKDITTKTQHRFFGVSIESADTWDLSNIKAGEKITYRIIDNALQPTNNKAADLYLQFLSLYEIDGKPREELGESRLSTPMLSLPVNRTHIAFESAISLATNNEPGLKFSVDAATSRTQGSVANLAIFRLASRYRALLDKDNGRAMADFKSDKQVAAFTKTLGQLGYEWDLVSVNSKTNSYEIQIRKQGYSFLMSAASSGEKELLTYLFAIYALDLHDALIVIDEPELHLHPRWQSKLLNLFKSLADETGNQFLFATHSPAFVSPTSIKHVSRVYSSSQRSHIVRLDPSNLPLSKHLFSIINSHNNERLFFSDYVILVEGISDRLFFESLLRRAGLNSGNTRVCEVISVGGKTLFSTYEKVLQACRVPYLVIADLDYIENIGTPEVKPLFSVDLKQIDSTVFNNPNSKDGSSFASSLDAVLSGASVDMENLRKHWDYIKGRHRKLRTDLSPAEHQKLEDFHKQTRANGVFVLRKGALEDYLPSGFQSKDVEKLLQFLETDFFDDLAPDAKSELNEIIQSINTAILLIDNAK